MRGREGLSEDEMIRLNMRSLIDSTENGGLISWFYNSGADMYADTLGAPDRLDAADVRRKVERVAALFAG